MRSFNSRAALHPGWVAAGAVLALSVAAPALNEWAEYRRVLVSEGQVWRLATGAWAHLSTEHALGNALGVAVLAALFSRASKADGLWLAGWGLAVFIVEHLWLGHDWARGLSGPAHAYAVYLAVLGAFHAQHRISGLLVLGGVALKLLAEGFGFTSAALIGGAVLTSHHLVGAALGACCAAASLAAMRWGRDA